jgi:hypothetical protein
MLRPLLQGFIDKLDEETAVKIVAQLKLFLLELESEGGNNGTKAQ